MMIAGIVFVVLTLVNSVLLYSQDSWQNEQRGEIPGRNRGEVYNPQNKRQMFSDHNIRRRMPEGLRARDAKMKLSGLQNEDDFIDETVSVASGPPPHIRQRFEKPARRTQQTSNSTKPQPAPTYAVNLIKEVLNQLAKEFITRQVDEEFVFGQYVGNAMRSLKSDFKLKMQHELLDVIVKYQLLSRGEKLHNRLGKEKRIESNKRANETEDWADFPNLAKIMNRD